MADRKKYSREGVFQVIQALFATIKARANEMDVPYKFIDEHPWTLKYLSHFSEANSLLEMCRREGARVVESPWNEELQALREARGMKPQLRFRITTPLLPKGHEPFFAFEDQGDGTFIPLNN